MGATGTRDFTAGGRRAAAWAGAAAVLALACVAETERRPEPPRADPTPLARAAHEASAASAAVEGGMIAPGAELQRTTPHKPEATAEEPPLDDRRDAPADAPSDAERGATLDDGDARASADADADEEASCDRRCVGGDQDGDDLLTPVDRDRGLTSTWAPDDLVALDPPYVIPEGSPPNLLRKPAADALVALSDAAFAATGVRVNIRSGYRPFALQCSIFRAEIRRLGCVEATRSSARAGFSEHQLGTTADLAIGWRRLDGEAAIDDYLHAHAHEFGWVLSYPDGAEASTGYKHEPWHYRYVGVDAARDLVARSGADRRLSTQEYLASTPAGAGAL